MGDERPEQTGSDETIPALVWLDDGVKMNDKELGYALAHTRGVKQQTVVRYFLLPTPCHDSIPLIG